MTPWMNGWKNDISCIPFSSVHLSHALLHTLPSSWYILPVPDRHLMSRMSRWTVNTLPATCLRSTSLCYTYVLCTMYSIAGYTVLCTPYSLCTVKSRLDIMQHRGTYSDRVSEETHFAQASPDIGASLGQRLSPNDKATT